MVRSIKLIGKIVFLYKFFRAWGNPRVEALAKAYLMTQKSRVRLFSTVSYKGIPIVTTNYLRPC